MKGQSLWIRYFTYHFITWWNDRYTCH